MKYPMVAFSLIILAIFFLLTNTAEAYLVTIYATNDSYANPISTCVPYVTNCDGQQTKICDGQEEICTTKPTPIHVLHSKCIGMVLGNLKKQHAS
ncbi:2517_t:CDS:2 [Gigaspora margarita]|uniref:2517_t:CDS:1 n=1 Tax=Gigaspora margarita TaxID=4874 RepID=A0ABN7UJ66_GIGMA|nr:2517_t:CDS:2 [Gigaspora margarita]